MKTSILILLTSFLGINAYSQSDLTASKSSSSYRVEESEKEKKEREEKEKKEKEEKEKKDKENNGPITGLEELNSLSMVSVYPNPASDQLFISNIPTSATTYIITNMDGMEVSKGSVNGSQLGLNVKNFNRGIYSVDRKSVV